ncbi:T9SS type A sorting domain-containing protein [Polluticoccus soli]|uniref:T9SS type A sorting domain-containing protein n=1 Tax=Polluticoccus soli TaxID=3034150 RepID=UPI0023E23D39|nr:T9SS type A sorting domain-containing protein [Flavipsychrobacter sp. JY13-12]
MKRIYLLMLLAAGVATNASAQKQPNLSLVHSWGKTSTTVHVIADNDEMLIDGDGVAKMYLSWSIINHGATANDTIAVSDTVKVRTGWTTYKISWGQNGFPMGMTQHDTVGMVPNPNPVDLDPGSAITTSQNNVAQQWCDSVFIVSGLPAPNNAVDPVLTNNKTCNNVKITYWLANVNEVIGGNGLLMYPNPANGKMTIKYVFANTDASVQVVDVAGKVVYAKDLGKNLSGMQEHALDLHNLNPGMYFLRLQTNDQIVTDKFFVRSN